MTIATGTKLGTYEIPYGVFIRPTRILRISLLMVKVDSGERRGCCRRAQIRATSLVLRATMSAIHLNPWHILAISLAGCLYREQAAVIEYLPAEGLGRSGRSPSSG